MTKRFTYEKHKVKDNLTGEFHSSNMVSVNVLNKFNDTVREYYDCIKQLEKENEELRKLTNILNTNAKDIVDVLNEQENKIWELKEENEQLKKEKQSLIQALSDASRNAVDMLFKGDVND